MPVARNQVNSASALSVGRVVTIGLGVFVAFLIVMFPARVAWNLVPQAMVVTPVGIEGSIWRGHAQSLLLNGRDLGSLSWRWNPASLVVGRWGYRVELSGSWNEANGVVGVGFTGNLIVTDMVGNASIEDTIAAVLPEGRQLPLVVDGDLRMDLDELRLDDQALIELAGRISTADLAIGGRRIGQLGVDLSDENQGVLAAIYSDGDPSPGIEGEAFLLPGEDYRLDVVVADPQRLGNDIDTFVRGFGAPEPDGSWRIRWQGQLP